MKRYLLPVCFLWLIDTAALPGQNNGTLHLITSVDNINADVREGCGKDKANAAGFFQRIADDAGMDFKPYQLPFDRDKVEQFLAQFQCAPDDAVIFIYSGHGFRYEDDGEEFPWPYLYYCRRGSGQSNENCELDLDEVQQLIMDKGPRMSLTLGNSCNDAVDNPEVNARLAQTFELPQDPNPGGEGDFHNLELLTDFSGHIIASACSPGQHSYTTDEEGSFFINDLFAELDNALDSEQSISWKTILEKTKTRVKKEGNGQTPQYWISHN